MRIEDAFFRGKRKRVIALHMSGCRVGAMLLPLHDSGLAHVSKSYGIVWNLSIALPLEDLLLMIHLALSDRERL